MKGAMETGVNIKNNQDMLQMDKTTIAAKVQMMGQQLGWDKQKTEAMMAQAMQMFQSYQDFQASQSELGRGQQTQMQQNDFSNQKDLMDQQFKNSFDIWSKQHDVVAGDLRSMGLEPGMASLGGGLRMPATTNQVAAQGSNYRASVPGNPRTSAFQNTPMQSANGWGDLLSSVSGGSTS